MEVIMSTRQQRRWFGKTVADDHGR